MAADERLVRVKWHGNKSSRYDGKVQDMQRRLSEAQDQVGIAVKVRWGRQARLWTAVMVSPLEDLPPTNAEPAIVSRKRGSTVSSKNLCKFKFCTCVRMQCMGCFTTFLLIALTIWICYMYVGKGQQAKQQKTTCTALLSVKHLVIAITTPSPSPPPAAKGRGRGRGSQERGRRKPVSCFCVEKASKLFLRWVTVAQQCVSSGTIA